MDWDVILEENIMKWTEPLTGSGDTSFPTAARLTVHLGEELEAWGLGPHLPLTGCLIAISLTLFSYP